jgi:hypothetical protein
MFTCQETTNPLTPDDLELYAVDLMPTTTEATLKSMIPPKYHDFLDIFDPEGPTCQLPLLCPRYDFKIPLDLTKLLLPLARPYHWNHEETTDWQSWCNTALKAGWIEKAPMNTPTATPFFFVWKKDGS